MHICVFVYVGICIRHMYIGHICLHMCLYMHTYIHTHTHIHTQTYTYVFWGFPGGSVVTEIAGNLPTMQETWVWSLGQEDPCRRKWQPTPVFLPGEPRRQRSLAGYSPRESQGGRHDWAAKQQQQKVCIHVYACFLFFFLYCVAILSLNKTRWQLWDFSRCK